MYKIVTEDFFGTDKIKLCNESAGEYLSILPAFGGNINELVLGKNGNLHNIIEGDKSLESLSGNKENYYRGAKLSPFPNRINNGKYQFEGNEYQLEQNSPPHALHGLCWNKPFVLRHQHCIHDSARLFLQYSCKGTDKAYPFSYNMEIEYILGHDGFTCMTRITNKDKQPIPIGDGWHPYFTTGSKVDELKLQLPRNKEVELGKDMIPTGKYLAGQFESPALIGALQLDHCFQLVEEDNLETRLIDEKQGIAIVISQKGYHFIQVYTPPHRNSIAIEPMSCSPDAFNNKRGLKVLSPNEEVEYSFGVHLE